MNKGAAADLLSQFVIEIDQHLDAIEPVLGTAETDTLKRADIDLLFREFHSIKGLTRVVAATGMEELAHEAETLLAPVRSGNRLFDAAIQEPLLAAADALRDALAEPLDWQPPQGIIDAMRAAIAAAVAGGGSGESASGAEGGEPWRLLGDELDLLRAFAELLDENLPDAAQAILNRDEAALGEAVEAVAFACTRMAYDGLCSAAQSVVVHTGSARVGAFAKLMQMASRFGALIGADCGVAEALVLLRDLLQTTLMTCLDEALAARPQARRALIRRCIWLCDVQNTNSQARRLLEDIVDKLPITVAATQDPDALMVEGLTVLKSGFGSERDTDMSVAEFCNAVGAPYRASEEIEAHLRRLGLDTKLFSPGPPRRLERLGTLLDGSGATLKEVLIAAVTPDTIASLAPLDPVLGQSTIRGRPPGMAVLLLDADTPATAVQDIRSGVGEARRLDPGHVASEFSLSAGSAGNGAELAGEAQVRVPVAVLDKLFGRVGEFFSIGSRLNMLATESDVPDALRRLSDFAATRAPRLQADIETVASQYRDFTTVEAEVGRMLSLIHESTLGLRVIPLEMLLGRFPHMVRDTARTFDKQVRFQAETGGIRIDKGMSDMLVDPLTHMLRNAIDHGVEPEAERLAQGKPRTAILRLIAQQQGNRIVMELSDDGRGIDIERVKARVLASRLASEDEIRHMSDEQLTRFIFTPGFSTKQEITDLSGRGVGMDVVLVHVTKLGGKIDITTQAGRGTTFRLDLPLSAAIQPMLLADTGVQAIGFPEAMVSEALMFPSAAVQYVNGQRAILLRDRFLPVFSLTELLQLPAPVSGSNSPYLAIVLCQWAGQRMGIQVRRILRRGEMLIREAHPRVAALPGIGGITSMGADRIVLVVDPEGMFDLARKASVSGLQVPRERLALDLECPA